MLKMNVDLSQSTMLVAVSFSQWGKTKTDAKRSEEYSKSQGLEKDAVKTVKCLFGGNANEYKSKHKQIQDVVTKAREFWRANTLPWGRDGERILLAINHDNFAREMRTFEAEFNSKVQEFANCWNACRDRSKELLNHGSSADHFVPEFYPETSESLQARYDWNIDIRQTENPDDFRVDLIAEQVEEIKSSMRAQSDFRAKQAMNDVYHRLASEVKSVKIAIDRQQLKKGSRFSPALIDNLKNLIDIIPKLNLTDDPELVELANKAKQDLTGDEVILKAKKDKTEAEKMSQKADQLLDDISAKMAVFSK